MSLADTVEFKPSAEYIFPTGQEMKAMGFKEDSGKNRLSLVVGSMARAIEQVGLVATFGALKYSPNGWIHVDDGIERYTDALHRHLIEEAKGDLFDHESRLLHAAHSAWNALARLDLMIRENERNEKKGYIGSP